MEAERGEAAPPQPWDQRCEIGRGDGGGGGGGGGGLYGPPAEISAAAARPCCSPSQ